MAKAAGAFITRPDIPESSKRKIAEENPQRLYNLS